MICNFFSVVRTDKRISALLNTCKNEDLTYVALWTSWDDVFYTNACWSFSEQL